MEETGLRKVRNLQILGRRCIGCENCVDICPHNVLGMMYKEGCEYATIEFKNRCVGCGLCMSVCPVDAILFTSASLVKTI